MLNIKKYQKEIMEVYNIISDNNPHRSFGDNFGNALFSVFLSRKSQSKDETADVLDWLISEYKEPILTDDAKEYLKSSIKPFKCSSVCRTWGPSNGNNEWYQLKFFTDNGNFYTSILYENTTQLYEYFKDMEINRTYKLEELGL